MPSKLLYTLLALALLGGMAYFAWTNPSYQRAFEAKWYIVTGDYETAYALADEAYRLDPYNRLSLSVMTQAKAARQYVAYLKEGSEYLHRIERIVEKRPLSDADRVRIKLMCEVMIEAYRQLPDPRFVDPELAERAKRRHDEFVTLYASLFKQK